MQFQMGCRKRDKYPKNVGCARNFIFLLEVNVTIFEHEMLIFMNGTDDMRYKSPTDVLL